MSFFYFLFNFIVYVYCGHSFTQIDEPLRADRAVSMRRICSICAPRS